MAEPHDDSASEDASGDGDREDRSSPRPGSDEASQLPSIEVAIREIRWEGRKAALVNASVDAMLALLLVNFAFTVFALDVDLLGGSMTVGLPPAVTGPARDAGLYLPSRVPLAGSLLLGLVVAGTVFAVELAVLLRRNTLEYFEAHNRTVREALRTARDAAEDGEDSVVARALYRQVIDRLAATSSREFLDGRRLVLSVLLVGMLAAAAVGLTVAGIQVDPGGFVDGTDGGAGPGAGPGTGSDGAGDGGAGVGGEIDADVLGERESVDRGTVDRGLDLEGEGEGGGGARGGDYDASGFSIDPADVEAAHAEYTAEGELADAELIRSYGQRIREQEAAG